MKFLLIFLLFSSSLKMGAVETSTQDTFEDFPVGLLTFSEKIPIEVNSQNKKQIEKERFNQKERNQQINKFKTFPWKEFFLAFVACITFLLLRYFPRKKTLSLKKVQSAEEIAKLSLAELKNQNVDVSSFYEKLSDILRVYIEERYQIKAPSKTTEEFLTSLKNQPLKLDFIEEQKVSQFLKKADLIKFAHVKPTENECKEALDLVNTFIKHES